MLLGSVLGPLLVQIFINEVTHQIPPGIMSLFADDIALYRPVSSIEDYIILQNDATAIVNWVANSLLSLQSAKCCYNMVISRKRSLRLHPPLILVNIKFSHLMLINNVKCLPWAFRLANSDLSWTPHVSYHSLHVIRQGV